MYMKMYTTRASGMGMLGGRDIRIRIKARR